MPVRGSRRRSIVLCAAWVVLATTAHGAPGDLDPSFSGDGNLTTSIPGASQAVARAVVALPDGKLLVAGTAGNGSEVGIALVRYLEDGTPDPAFGTGGIVVLPLGAAVARGPVGLARRADGKLVVAATSLGGDDADFLVALLGEDAALDGSFGDGGTRTIDFGGEDHLAALALDAQERPVLVGRGGAASRFAVARLTAGGDPDAAFAGDGMLTTDASGAGLASAAYDVALQADGKLVVVGEASNGTDLDFALVRYDDAGTPDPLFGGDGIVLTPLGSEPFLSNDDVARGVTLQPDGKIVAAGHRQAAIFLVVVARYDSSGALDPGFGDGGIATTEGLLYGEGLIAIDVVREPNGKLVTAGRAVSNQIISVGVPALVRFTADGDRDATFGPAGDGVVLNGRPFALFGLDQIHALLRDPRGRLVTVGFAQDFPPTSPSSFAVARFLSDRMCAGGPASACLVSTVPAADLLELRDPLQGHERLRWAWRRGEATALADFGAPNTTDDYELCVFDDLGARLLLLHAPAGDHCPTFPCWTSRANGFVYADRERTPDGVARVVLRAGGDGAASVQVEARGPLLDLPDLPLVPPLTVQLHASNGACWQSTYEAAGVRRNDARVFSARGTP